LITIREHQAGVASDLIVDNERDIVLIVAELGDRHVLLHPDGHFAHEVNAAHMAVEVDAHVSRAATCSLWADLPVPW
jgi:hypothetical protein